jgi:hypothetical protein
MIRKSEMKTSSNNKEKRKHPRTMVSLPLHFQANENGGVYPSLTIDASESCLKEMDFIERRDHPSTLVVITE